MKEEIELEREIIYAEENKQRIKYLYLLIKRYIINIGGNDMKERLKSPVVWGEIVLLIAQLLKYLGVYEMPNEAISIIQDLISYGFYLFAGVNNPTDRKHF